MDADHPLFERRTQKNPLRMIARWLRGLVDGEPGNYIAAGALFLCIAAVSWLTMALVDWGILLSKPHTLDLGREFSRMLSAAVMKTAPLMALTGVGFIVMGSLVSWIQKRASRHTDHNQEI